MTSTTRHIAWASLALGTAWIGAGTANAQVAGGPTSYGTDISNVATLTFTTGDNAPRAITTNAAVFTVEPPITPATIQFFRYAPTASFAVPTAINGSDYAPTGDAARGFTALPAPVNPGGVSIDTSRPVPLIPARSYLAGEVMFVEVTDENANRDGNAIDTVVITIETDSGDLITLRLYETGANTGKFYGYVPSTREASPQNDTRLTTPSNTNLTATYSDALDQTDIVFDTALVDPLNRVFSTLTGDLVSGAVITLVDAAGTPVETFGIDGFSTFPAVQTSGTSVTDGAGLVYELGEGEFRFPVVETGEYAIRVDPPEGFTFSSQFDADTITANTDGSFTLSAASFGEIFTVAETGALRFDIPLDPQTELVVTKTADAFTADVGDFVTYTVTVENAGLATVPLNVRDTLPIGFRYVPGTARVQGVAVADPAVSDNSTQISFDAGTIAPGERVDMRYALLVGPGAPLGDAVNRALVVDPLGQPLSNIARAEVRLREDLLRSTSTIIGRISENSCDSDEDWARDIVRGDGVEGVRLYTETGAYAVSDADGLYHFEGVREGVSVVQVDLETLPKGFEIKTCEENTRYAGRNFSKFIDVQGGGIWRANFYLQRVENYDEIVAETRDTELDERLEYTAYDEAWIETQDASPAFVYPAVGRSAARPSVHMGIKHAPDQTVRLSVNGKPVANTALAARMRNIGNSVMLTRFRGVDVLEGGNAVVAEVINADGTVARTLTRDVAYVTQIARAAAVPDLSTLVADGRTAPQLAIRLEDQAGRPVHAGRVVTVDVEDPYLLNDPNRDLRIETNEGIVSEAYAARDGIEVGAGGILSVPLEPTLRTGKVTVVVTLDNGRQMPFSFYLEPEKRDWVVVGLAEGTVGYETIKDKAIDLDADDTFTDGRVAFFAKGLIKGEWLLTLAVDTDQRRSGTGNRDAGFEREIDPNAYYTLYGDRSYQEFEAVSRYPVYVKLEKRQGYALFGDYDTDIKEGRLTAYNRRLSGLKAEYVGENIQVMGFGAETNQAFAKDELAADGTSGTYQLSNTRLLAQSEQIVVETRDRVRPDIILERKTLVRYLDYTLDYFTGQLIFRLPVDATDPNFNPNVIVVDYETSEDVEQNITFGGRAQAELLDDRVRVGVTAVHEDGSALAAGSEGTMVGVDIVAQASENTTVRAEYAVTENKGGTDAEAILAEVVHTSEDLQLETYYRREEGGYGLGQRNSNTLGAQRYGVRADYKVSETENVETGRRTQRFVSGAAYREDNLSNGASRSNLELSARHDSDRLDVTAGVRVTEDNLIGQDDRQSVIATATASYALPAHGANVSVSHEQPLGSDADEVSIYPARTILGVDKTVGDWAVATLRHEITEGAQAVSHNTALGLNMTPWAGGQLTVGSDVVTQDSARRIGATVGLDQTVPISDQWSASAGVRARRVLDSEGEYIEPVGDAVQGPFERNEDFQSGYVGVAYRDAVMSASARLEGRSAQTGDTYIGTAGVARELSEVFSVAGAARGVMSEVEGSARAASQLDVRVGAAWRPRDEDMVVYNRFDWQDLKAADGRDTTKLVNNAAMNVMLADNWQLTSHFGAKYVQTDLLGDSLDSWALLGGMETRFDLTEWLDLGLRAQGMKVSGSDSLAYSWGPSVGISPVDNLWMSLGYNVEGLDDDDFEAAEYSRDGLYLQVRFKFDQQSARGLLKRISPNAYSSNGEAGDATLP